MTGVNQYLQEILPAVIEAGKFGIGNAKFLSFVEDKNCEDQPHFASEVLFGNVVMVTKNNGIKSQSVVIKVHTNTAPHNLEALYAQFYNELLFYSDVLPFLRAHDPGKIIDTYFPRFFYGVATLGVDPSKDILIFENLQTSGFRPTSSRTFIDEAHFKLSLAGIARFHSLTLIAKKQDPEGLRKIVATILETSYSEKILKEEAVYGFFKKSCARGILPLQEDPVYKDKLDTLWKMAEKPLESMKKITTPVEPLAVICHGDFCKNNQLYRYNDEGEPIDVKFFDLGTFRYSSPVIDLSFFLFLNTSPEMRSRRWDEFIKMYADELKSSLSDKNISFPSLTDVSQDFQRRGFGGYVNCSFYLPMCLAGMSIEDPELANGSKEDIMELLLHKGGEEATELVSAIVRHMIDRNFDFDYILNPNQEESKT